MASLRLICLDWGIRIDLLVALVGVVVSFNVGFTLVCPSVSYNTPHGSVLAGSIPSPIFLFCRWGLEHGTMPTAHGLVFFYFPCLDSIFVSPDLVSFDLLHRRDVLCASTQLHSEIERAGQ